MENKLLEKLKLKIDDKASQLKDTNDYLQENLIEKKIKDEKNDNKKNIRKNISITSKHQKMLDEMNSKNCGINLSSISRREIEKAYNEFIKKNNW